MKNNYSVEERNRIVEEHLWCVDTVISRNERKIRSAQLESDDVRQELCIRLIRAAAKYAKAFGDLRDFIFAELEQEMRLQLSKQDTHGLTGALAVGGGIEVVPLSYARRTAACDEYDDIERLAA